MSTVQLSVLHPAGAPVTYSLDAPPDASMQQLMTIADNAIALLSAAGYRFDETDAEALEEGEKRDTATAYVTGETSNGDKCIWGYHFPRDKKTIVIYPEQFHLWPFEIDWSKPWPSSTAPTYAEAKRKGYLRDLPETAEFVRRPTGKMWEGKPETKFHRMIRPVAVPQAQAQKPTVTADQPPAQPRGRVPTAEELAKAQAQTNGSEAPTGVVKQNKDVRKELIDSIAILFGVQGEELEKRIAWYCRVYTAQKFRDQPEKHHGDINLLLTDDLRKMADAVQNDGDKVIARYAKYLEAMTPPRI